MRTFHKLELHTHSLYVFPVLTVNAKYPTQFTLLDFITLIPYVIFDLLPRIL